MDMSAYKSIYTAYSDCNYLLIVVKGRLRMSPRILVHMVGLMCKFSGLEFIIKACIDKYMEEGNIQMFI